MWREFDEDFTLIFVVVPASNGAAFHKAIYQFDGAVMAKAKLLRKCGDGGTAVPWQSFDGQQYLVLLRFKSLGAGCILAEVQELTDTVTELGKAPKAELRYIRS